MVGFSNAGGSMLNDGQSAFVSLLSGGKIDDFKGTMRPLEVPNKHVESAASGEGLLNLLSVPAAQIRGPRMLRWGLSISETKSVLTTAQASYKGSTVVGHALSKHAGRRPDVWGKMSGAMSTWNGQGMVHLREIIRAPGSFTIQVSNGLSFREKMLSDGRGIRLNMDGTFKGFIDK